MGRDSIAVVVTTHNRKYELRRALESVYAQDLSPDEIVVIDDNSDDGSKEYIYGFGFENLRYVYLEDRHGCGFCRNYGLSQISSAWIAFLDSDNVWRPDKLLKCSEKFAPEVDIVWHRFGKHYGFDIYDMPYNKYDTFRSNILAGDIPDMSATVFRSSFLKGIDGFDEELMTNLDWGMYMRLLADGVEIRDRYIADILSENHTMHDSLEENTDQWIADRLSILNSHNELFGDTGDKQRFLKHYCSYLNLYSQDSNGFSRLISSVTDPIEWSTCAYNVSKFDLVADINRLNASLTRKSDFYLTLRKWLKLKLQSATLATALSDKGYRQIGIYGAGAHGKLLADDLTGSDIRIACWIEQNKKDGVYSVDDELPDLDAVIVTPYLEYESIRRTLEEKGLTCPIISLRALIEMMV